jgi:hypothetical protein
MSVATYQAAIDSMNASIASEDWASARKYCLQAMGLGASIPRSKRGDSELEIKPEQLPNILKELRTLAADSSASSTSNAGGMRQSKITWGATTP